MKEKLLHLKTIRWKRLLFVNTNLSISADASLSNWELMENLEALKNFKSFREIP